LKKVFDGAEVRQKVAGVGLYPVWMDAAAVTAMIRSDLEKWTRVVQKAGIKTE